MKIRLLPLAYAAYFPENTLTTSCVLWSILMKDTHSKLLGKSANYKSLNVRLKSECGIGLVLFFIFHTFESVRKHR